MTNLKLQVIAPAELKADAFEGALTNNQFAQYLREGAVSSELPLEAYAQLVEVLFRCLDLRTSAISGLPRQLVNKETGEIVATANWPQPLLDDDNTPLTEERLFDQLLLKLDLTDLLWRTELAQCLLAQAYWFVQRRGRRIVGARWMDPVRVTPQYNAQGLWYFDYNRVVGGLHVSNDPVPVEDVCYIWRPGLRELMPGSPPAAAAAQAAGLVYNASLFLRVFFANGAMPVTVVMSEDQPPEEERNRLKMFLGRMMRGVQNAFNIEVVSSLLKFETLTPRIKDLDFTNMASQKEKSIAVAMGVPLSILFSGVGNYAGSSEKDDLHFYDKTIVPQAQFLARIINRQFFHPLGLSLAFRPDLLEVYQQREMLKVETAIQLFDRRVIDGNELRQAAGYEPIEDSKLEDEEKKTPATAVDNDDEDDDEPPEGDDNQDADRQADLKRWERKVMKALKQGRDPTAVSFVSKHLSVWETDAIQQALATATTAEEVKAVMARPFVVRRGDWHGPAPASRARQKAQKAHREDDRELGKIERTAVREIHDGLQAQLAALEAQANELGARNIDALIVQMAQVVDDEKGELTGATQQLIYASTERGATAVAQVMPRTLSMLVDWQMMSKEAFTFSQTYSFDLVTDLNKTTERGLRYALETWIEEGGTLDDLADSIRPIFANEAATKRIEALFGIDRARLIATTEATRAYAQGKVDAWMASGEAEVPPAKIPPAHPGCRCDIAMERQTDGSWFWRWDTARDDRVCPICSPYISSPYVGVARRNPRDVGNTAVPNETIAPVQEPVIEQVVSPAPLQDLTVALRNVERQIATSNTESAYVFSPQGEMLLRQTGDQHSVVFSPDDIPLMNGAIMTHNHPGGRTFSAEDLAAFNWARLKEIRAVGVQKHTGHTVVYRMEALDDVVYSVDQKEWRNLSQQMKLAARAEVDPLFYGNQIDVHTANHLVDEIEVQKVVAALNERFEVEALRYSVERLDN